MTWRLLLACLCASAFLGTSASTAAAQAQSPQALAVVELFTAQGCSACRSANASLAQVADAPGVLALTFPVDHWDYLGWRDTFARPEFTMRQRAYAEAMGARGLTTPQVVINGQRAETGHTAARLHEWALHSLLAARTKVRLRRTADSLSIEIGANSSANAPADVWLMQFEPRSRIVTPARGENAGAPVMHRNLVRAVTRLGVWRGASANFEATCTSACAVIVQEPNGGAVLAAAVSRR